MISLPYYLGVLVYEGEIPEIAQYINTKAGLIFVMIMSFSVFLACTSEVAGKSFYIIANYITMKISPFEKAIVSNIKDLILVVISV